MFNVFIAYFLRVGNNCHTLHTSNRANSSNVTTSWGLFSALIDTQQQTLPCNVIVNHIASLLYFLHLLRVVLPHSMTATSSTLS
jgi:hypothetical protein